MPGESYIRVYDDIVEEESCQRYIKAFHDSPFVGHGAAQQGSDRSFKLCDELYLREAVHRETDPERRELWRGIYDELFDAIQPLLTQYIKELKYLVGTKYGDEGFRFKRYPAGNGHFGLHYDATPSTPKRVFSMILYLCDVAEGGETEFPEQKLKIKPKTGRLMVAPPFWTHPHRGNVPVSNDKYIINSFFEFQ